MQPQNTDRLNHETTHGKGLAPEGTGSVILRYYKIAVVLLFVGVIFFGFFRLSESPSFLFDEGWYFQTSANLATTGIDGLQIAPGNIEHFSTYVTVGYPLIYSLALWFKIFSIGVFQARFLMVLFILGFVLAGYFLAKKLFGKNIALAALAVIATFPPLYGNGKSVMGEVPGLFFLASFLFCLTCARNESRRKKLFLILAGISAGLCVAVKPLFILLLPALLIGVIVEWRRKNLTIKEILIGILATLVPIIIWFILQFRLGDSLPETLTYYANPYNIGNIYEIIFNNFKNLFLNISTLYTVFIILAWAVAFFARIKAKVKMHVAEIVAFIFSILIFAAYLRTSGMYRYFFTAQAITLIFFPFSALYISEMISKKFTFWKSKKMFTALMIILCLLGIYQLCFDSWVADTYSSHKTADLYKYFSGVSTSTSVFFYHAPEVVPFMNGRNYYQYIINYYGSQGAESLEVLKNGKVDRVIVQSVLFKENEKDVFRLYKERESLYKYSVLEKR